MNISLCCTGNIGTQVRCYPTNKRSVWGFPPGTRLLPISLTQNGDILGEFQLILSDNLIQGREISVQSICMLTMCSPSTGSLFGAPYAIP